jgi:hypothetical protein
MSEAVPASEAPPQSVEHVRAWLCLARHSVRLPRLWRGEDVLKAVRKN